MYIMYIKPCYGSFIILICITVRRLNTMWMDGPSISNTYPWVWGAWHPRWHCAWVHYSLDRLQVECRADIYRDKQLFTFTPLVMLGSLRSYHRGPEWTTVWKHKLRFRIYYCYKVSRTLLSKQPFLLLPNNILTLHYWMFIFLAIYKTTEHIKIHEAAETQAGELSAASILSALSPEWKG